MPESLQKLPSLLLTGATGFVGSRLARRLVDESEAVHVIVRPDSKLDQIAPFANRLRIHRWDGTMNSLTTVFQQTKPEIVFHVASLFLAAHTPADVPRLIQSNVEFGTMLLEAVAAAGVSRLVNAGTSWEHFENAPYRPVNLYAATKHAFEALIDYYVDARALRVITLKLFDTYGPSDPRPKLMAALLRAAREAKTIEMSPGDQLLDMVYIDDVAEAFLIAARCTAQLPPGTHERFAISSGNPLTLKNLVAAASVALNKNIPVNFGARPYRPREVMTPWNQGATLPGWHPRTTLTEGLRQTYTESRQ